MATLCIGVPDDLEATAWQTCHRCRHLIEDQQARRPQDRTARLELDDAIGQRLVHHRLLLHGHTQAVAHSVGRVERLRHLAGKLLAHGFVAHLALEVHRLPLHAELTVTDLLQGRRQQLLHMLRPLWWRHHRAQRQLVHHPFGTIELTKARDHGDPRGLVRHGPGHHHLARPLNLRAPGAWRGLRAHAIRDEHQPGEHAQAHRVHPFHRLHHIRLRETLPGRWPAPATGTGPGLAGNWTVCADRNRPAPRLRPSLPG